MFKKCLKKKKQHRRALHNQWLLGWSFQIFFHSFSYKINPPIPFLFRDVVNLAQISFPNSIKKLRLNPPRYLEAVKIQNMIYLTECVSSAQWNWVWGNKEGKKTPNKQKRTLQAIFLVTCVHYINYIGFSLIISHYIYIRLYGCDSNSIEDLLNPFWSQQILISYDLDQSL